MKSSKIVLLLGIVSSIAAWSYADGFSFAVLSTIFFLPALALAAVLHSRVRRKKVEEKTEAFCAVSVGAWLLFSSGAGALLVSRPGWEGSGMFGGLIFTWPAVVGFTTCIIVFACLPAKRLTYT
jgi:hypothetical protein